LCSEVGIEGLNEKSVGYIDRLRRNSSAILAALDGYTPNKPQPQYAWHVLSDDEIALALQRARLGSGFPLRDVAMLAILLVTGARPLEIARLEIHDYLNADGSVREVSTMREEVANKRKARPLFFTTKKVNDAIDAYLRSRDPFDSDQGNNEFRGLKACDRLFLNDEGKPFEVLSDAEIGGKRSKCHGIHGAYAKIFRRVGMEGISTLKLRRTLANRMLVRGATEDQIGEILGIDDTRTLRELLPDVSRPLDAILRDLV
jgi:integrase